MTQQPHQTPQQPHQKAQPLNYNNFITSISTQRFEPYLQATSNNKNKALQLYQWSATLAGHLHTQISYTEIALRNAINEQLKTWHRGKRVQYKKEDGTWEERQVTQDWTEPKLTAAPLYSLIGLETMKTADKDAHKARRRRDDLHPRKRAAVNHEDRLAQFPFHVWVKIIADLDGDDEYRTEKKQQLWQDALHKAFPHANNNQSDTTRIEIGKKLERIRRLRNRVSHNENLLRVNYQARVDEMREIIAYTQQDIDLITSVESIEKLLERDPRNLPTKPQPKKP